MERKILMPTDFSDNSWNAIVYTLKLYAEEVCTFFFLNATFLKVSTLSNLSNKLLKTMQDDAMKELLALKELAETSNANSNHTFDIILSSKDLKTAIETTVSKHDIDLVIMGTKGATGAKEFLFGSNTVNVMQNMSMCPVFVIPEAFDFVVPKQIAFPTDFNRFYSFKEINPLKDLTNLFDSKIRILHINKEEQLDTIQKYNLNTLKDYLKNHEYSFHWMPDYAKKVIGIQDFIEELDIDILAMVNYKHSFIENILKEPVIKKIGFSPTVPFFVIPE